MYFLMYSRGTSIWIFPKIGMGPPKRMVKIMEKPIKMDDLGVPLFLETPIYMQKSFIWANYSDHFPLVGHLKWW